jgi:hypothetical protein
MVQPIKDGRTSVESDARPDRQSKNRNDELIDQVRILVMQNSRVTVRELAEEVGISTGWVHFIMTDDLAFPSVCAKFVPKFQLIPQLIQTFLAKQNIPLF